MYFPKNTQTTFSAEELILQPPMEFLIEKMIPKNSVGFLFGEGGTFKSFLALDIAWVTSSGIGHWNGLEAGKAKVRYYCGEGSDGLGQRTRALKEKYNITPHTSMLSVVTKKVDLHKKFDEIEEEYQEELPDITIFDTLSACSGSANLDNNTSHAQQIMDKCFRLARYNGGSVLIIGHTPESNSKKLRGPGALKNASDYMLHMMVEDKDKGTIRLSSSRSKETAGLQDMIFQTNLLDDSLVLIHQEDPRPKPSPGTIKVQEYMKYNKPKTKEEIMKATKLGKSTVYEAIKWLKSYDGLETEIGRD